MSRKNNLNPDYYKTAGRGRQGDAVDQEAHRQKFTEEEARWAKAQGSVGRTSPEPEKKDQGKPSPAPGDRGKRDAAVQQPHRARRGAGSGQKAGPEVKTHRGRHPEEPGDGSAEGED